MYNLKSNPISINFISQPINYLSPMEYYGREKKRFLSQTGEQIKIKASKKVKFTPSVGFKEEVKNS